ncbi:Signal transduction histidine kinase [Halobaculum gomorrense]|uniref:histidine kinase n=1 Tax=Halobaculum gomorrense TaxID=43928 RepID=A0A1M5LX97_9EURY|nr:HAMP domain-containing sensor histidine kinase [Halobaculum gomorrense]SHG69724.1 Signal transduction histidine kinase [Halobaculum gomorrense]
MTADDAAGADSDDRLRSLYAATREIMTATTRAELCRVVVDVTDRVLGYTLTGVHLQGGESGDGHGLVPMAYPPSVRERFEGDPPTYAPDDEVYDVYEQEDPLRLGAVADRPSASHRGVVVPIPGHGVLIAGTEASNDPEGVPLDLVETLGEHAAVALDRLEHESRLNGLHETTRELMGARDSAAVAASATNTAHEVLGLRLNTVYLRASDGDRLVPVSVTSEARELYGDVPDITPGTVGWTAYDADEQRVIPDVRRSSHADRRTSAIRSLLAMPLGDHGVFLAASQRPGRFDDADVALAQLFADTVEAALDRAQREALVRSREQELSRQNERLDEFASVVSHDLRNPLNVAQGRLELLGDDCDSPHIGHLETAHERMEALIEDLLALARTGRSVGETEPVSVERTVVDVWGTIEGGASLSVADEIGAVNADPSRLRELFENLFGNAVEHAGDDVCVTVGPLDRGRSDDSDRGDGGDARGERPPRIDGRIRGGVDQGDGPAGFYVADDGPGISPEGRDAVFERGHTTAEDGTGFGLAIVSEIAGAHGWSVRATDAAGGGARFEVVIDG